MQRFAGAFRLLAALIVLRLASPLGACALELSHSALSGAETLAFTFEHAPSGFTVQRTGVNQVTVDFAKGFFKREKRPENLAISKPQLIRSIIPTSSGFVLTLGTSEFGFIRLPADGDTVQVQFFRDPFGAKWKPAAPHRPAAPSKPASRAAQTQAKKSTPEPVKKAEPFKAKAEEKSSVSKPQTFEKREPAAEPVPAGVPVPEPQMSAASPVEETQAGVEVQDAAGPDGPDKPFFSVSYAMRAPIQKGGRTASKVYNGSAVLPQEVAEGITSSKPEDLPAESKNDIEALDAGASVSTAPDASKAQPPKAAKPEVVSGPSLRMTASRKTLDELMHEPVAVPVMELPPVAPAKAPEAAKPEEATPDASVSEENGSGTEMGSVPEGEAAKPKQGVGDSFGQSNLEKRMAQEGLLEEARALMLAENWPQAAQNLRMMLADPLLLPEIRPEVQFDYANTLFHVRKNELYTSHGEITEAFDKAINLAPDSDKVPGAILSLGLLNLRVGNIPEARAYFNILKKKYPDDENIPFIDYYWGDYYYTHGDYQKAADRFQFLIQTYPDSKVVREASVGLAGSLDQLGYYQQAWQIVDYIDKRWPRYYVDSPEFLRLSGDIANKLDKLSDAKSDYWTFYNLRPEAEGMDVILARIGDIYLREKKTQAAREMYVRVAERYPDQEGGLVAKMRLAEEGIYDEPGVKEMFSVFDRPYNARPVDIYTQIIEKFPKSPLAPLAQLKLAMWYLWNNKALESLDAVDGFFRMYGKSSLAERALEVGIAAFEKSTAVAAAEKNYGKIVGMWDKFAFLRDNAGSITPDSRMAVAVSLFEEKKPERALEIARPFTQGEKQGKLSEMALNLVLSIYVDMNAWNEIVSMADATDSWELPEELGREIDYARALALVNLSRDDESRKYWAKLAADYSLDPGQRAYALYYMAKFAGEEGDLRKQFMYAQEALDLFLTSVMDKEKIRDTYLMLIDTTERAGRLDDALRYADAYNKQVPEDDPLWGAARLRLAEVHKTMGNVGEWRKILNGVISKDPDTIYARSAKSALEAWKLEQEARQYGMR